MSNAKISVIVPVYNIENYIENAVTSIRNQSYQDLEIIIVDDGSVDRSGVIVDELASQDSRIVVIHQANSGVTKARIAGIKASSGEWIGFVDGDDFIEDDMYQILMENASQYDADISHCGYQMVFPSRVDYYHNTEQLIEQDQTTGLRDLLSGKLVEPCLCNKIYKKSLFEWLEADSSFDDTIKHYEDLLMNYFLFKNSQKSVFLDRCYYHYILRKGSAATSSLNDNKLKDPLKVMKIIDADIPEDSPLKLVIKEKIISRLINDSTFSIKPKNDSLAAYRETASQELRNILPEFLKASNNKRLRIQAKWAGYWPASYRIVHAVYAKLTGVANKYEVK